MSLETINRKPVYGETNAAYGAVGQTTVTVIVPVTKAPLDDMSPTLWLVVTVAVTKPSPQASPVAVIRPVVASTVAISGVFDFQTAWLVMSLLTGG